MVRAAGSTSPAPTSSFASLERTLERTVETLMKGEPSSESKALLIEARRLRSVVANWRSIPPPSDVYDEMLDRVLHLSTAAGASLYEPSPDSLRTEFDPMLRTDYEPGLYDDFERTERMEVEPVPIAAIDVVPRHGDDVPMGPPRQYAQQAYSTPMSVSQYAITSGSTRRAPDPDPVISVDDGELSYSNESPGSYEVEAELEPPRPARPLVASSTGMRPAELPRTGAGMSPRGRPLRTGSGMAAFAAPRVPVIDDPPSYPAFDSPAAYADDDDAPSYPGHELEPTRPVAIEGVRARHSAPPPAPSSFPTYARTPSYAPPRMQSTPPPARTPSYPPARASSHPPPMRSAFPPSITGDRPRSYAPPEMVIEDSGAHDDEPIAPPTSVNVTAFELGEKIDPHIVMLSDAYSDRADAYRALRRKLATSGNPQVIAVTSPDAGEGKTTCALNLALAMRETSRGKVLLIEANGRSPALAKLLGFEPPECFCDQVTQRKEDPRRPWVAVEVMVKLHIMAVDPTIKRPPQLDPIAFSNGMERLKRAGYEYIVIDTPPVLGSYEVNMIADNVDGVLFTAITMKSKRSHLRKAMEQILPAPILGVMVLDS